MRSIHQRIAELSPEKRALLTLRLQQKQKQSPNNQRIPIRKHADRFPLSFAQERLWFLDQLEPGSPLYNIPAAIELIGSLQLQALKRCFNEIIRRHEVLRAVFKNNQGRPLQEIQPEMSLEIPVIDLCTAPPARQWMEVGRLVSAEAQRPFALAQGPLLRVVLLKLNAQHHVLLLTMHHIVFDGWSTRVMIGEISTLYEAFIKENPSPLPELEIQYADYAAWQKSQLDGEELGRQLTYWKKQLLGAPEVLELPTDRPRPPILSHRGRHHIFAVPRSTYQALLAFCRREEITVFTVLLGAFKVMLYRYCRQTDVCVGTPIANRNRLEVEKLIGFFVNTLVLRTDLSGSPKFIEILQRLRESIMGAFAHQELPFEKLVDELLPSREMSHQPLFQVMFDYEQNPLEHLRLGKLRVNLINVETHISKFDLMLTASELSNGLACTLEYNTSLFDAGTIEAMGTHYLNLLQELLENANIAVDALPMWGEAERRRVLNDWNDTNRHLAKDHTIARLFEARVKENPDSLAVFYEASTLTYDQLNRQANQLAHYLRKSYVGPESLVGLCLDRSVEMIVGILGIIKAGGAYLPLDPSYPPERLAYMIEDSGISVLLTQQDLLDTLPDTVHRRPCTVLSLDADWPVISQQPTTNVPSRVGPENLAYMIYTSGSTGRPKGVMVQQCSALHLAAALQQTIYFPIRRGPWKLGLNAPLPFDASVQQWLMLLYGHGLYVIPQEVRLDGPAFVAYVRRHGLDAFDCVPTQLKLLLEAGLLDASGPVPAAVLPGGEAIDDATWQILSEATDTEFFNMYGPTECTVDSTICRTKTAGKRPVIGRPVPNTRFYVLDDRLFPVPVGVAGELHIGGAGVGRGYFNRPDLTADKFIPDPFGHEPGLRLYRTGDLVRYLPDGNLEFLGRIDHQVKLRGLRIELGEIESILAQYPGLKEVAVITREDVPDDKRMVAYVVPHSLPAPKPTELRKFLTQSLPEYMLPSFFVELPVLPLTPNAKLDRRALPAPEQKRSDLENDFVAPRTAMERTLSDIWQEILGIEKVGVFDDFFELGGHSLMATQVVSRLRDTFQVELPLRDLFQTSTIAALSEKIETYHWAHELINIENPSDPDREEGVI